EVSTVDLVSTIGKVVTTADVEVNTAAITSQISMDEIILAKALIDIKTSKPKAKGIVIQEPKAAKRQRIEEENESAKLKRCLEIIPDDNDDVTIEATPLSSKSPTIVDYKIYKEGKKSFFNIIRADGRFQKTKPVDDMDNLLFQTLKIMFEHHVGNNIWKHQQGTAKVLTWKLFYLCAVYCVTTQNMVYFILVEKMYPFTRNILQQMWNDVRLQVDYKVEMAYDLLR
nr:hypothetical protein [Tanacetum cinerariifolium]